MTKEIQLTKGKVALVDDEDYELLSHWKWSAHLEGHKWYALRCESNKIVRMHRLITNVSDKKIEIDHCDGNGLNNQRNNLRASTRSQNQCNIPKYRNNTTGYKGVTWNKRKNLYQAGIWIKYKRIHLGYFTDPKQAAQAYDEAAKKYHGEFARPNF